MFKMKWNVRPQDIEGPSTVSVMDDSSQCVFTGTLPEVVQWIKDRKLVPIPRLGIWVYPRQTIWTKVKSRFKKEKKVEPVVAPRLSVPTVG